MRYEGDKELIPVSRFDGGSAFNDTPIPTAYKECGLKELQREYNRLSRNVSNLFFNPRDIYFRKAFCKIIQPDQSYTFDEILEMLMLEQAAKLASVEKEIKTRFIPI